MNGFDFLWGLFVISSWIPIKSQAPPVEFYFSYQLSFSPPTPTTIYLNQSFSIHVSAADSPPAELTTSIYLNCGSITEYTWNSVPFNQNYALTTPANLTVNNDCSFVTDGTPNYIAASSSVAVDKLTLQFAEPTVLSFNQTDMMPVELRTTTATESAVQGFAAMTLTCPGLTASTFDIDIGVLKNYTYPAGFYGPCILSASSPIFIVPSPLTININFVLSISTISDPVYIGKSFTATIGCTGTPPSFGKEKSGAVRLDLVCNGGVKFTWEKITFNRVENFYVFTKLTPETGCILRTSATPYYIQATSSQFSLAYSQLTFTQPSSGQEFSQNATIPILITSNTGASKDTFVTGNLNCPDSGYTGTIPSLAIGTVTQYYIPSEAYGQCTLSVDSPPQTYISPTPVTFTITNDVVFSNVPSTLSPGEAFIINLSSSISEIVQVDLICGTAIQQSWPVTVNTPYQATLNSSIPLGSSCFMQTAASSSYYNPASSSTILINGIVKVTSSTGAAIPSLISAGSVIELKLSATPTSSSNLVVSLACTGIPAKTGIITPDTTQVQLFYIPTNFYGNCSFLLVSNVYQISPAVNVVVTQAAWFLQPYPGSFFLVNDPIPVILTSNIVTNDTVTLFQNCNGTIRNYPDVKINSTISAIPPTDYIGSCAFWMPAKGMYREVKFISVSTVSVPQVSFVAPLNLTSVNGGASLGVRLFYSSPLAMNFTVQLDCSIPGKAPKVQAIPSNTASVVSYLISSDYYGTNCTLLIIDSPDITPVNNLLVTVTQLPIIAAPVKSGSYLIGTNISVLLLSPGDYPPALFTMVQNCNNSLINLNSVPFDFTAQATPPSGFVGVCTYSTLPINFYRANAVAVNVVYGSVTIVDPSNNAFVNSGSNLRIRLASNFFSVNGTTKLDCGIPGVAPVTVNITSNLNNWQGIAVPANFYGNACVLSISALPWNFIATNSVNITITQPVTITSPSSAQYLYMGSTFPVILTSPVNSTTATLSLTQNCSNTITTFSGLLLNTPFQAALPNPEYTGPCTYASLASSYYRASLPVSVVIVSSPSVAFTQPLNKTFINAGNKVGIILTSANYTANFTVQLNCAIPNILPVNITVASNPQLPATQLLVPGNFYGNCQLSVINPVAPFVPYNTVNITVTQPVTFVTPLPQAIYLVNTPIPVLLASPVVIPGTTVTLFQNCNGTVITYSNVNINSTVTATLPTDYVGSCTLWTTASANGIYRASGNLFISTVATPQVRFISPGNLSFVSAGTPIGVKLYSSSASSVFKVKLDCSISGALPVVANVSSNLAINTNVNVPSNFYGTSCLMSIIESPEFTPVNNVSITVTQATIISSPLANGNYLINEQVPLLLTSSVTILTPFNVTQNCNSRLNFFPNVTLGVTVQTSLPTNYTGNCVYTAQAVSFYRAASVQITVKQGTVNFVAPLNNSSIPPGKNTNVQLSATKVANFTVQLACSNQSLVPVSSTVLSGASVPFFVPQNFSANNCVFSVINPPSSYTPGNQVYVKVTAS